MTTRSFWKRASKPFLIAAAVLSGGLFQLNDGCSAVQVASHDARGAAVGRDFEDDAANGVGFRRVGPAFCGRLTGGGGIRMVPATGGGEQQQQEEQGTGEREGRGVTERDGRVHGIMRAQ